MEITQQAQLYRPLFLVFDGMDGSGKTTQLHRLADRLRVMGIPVAVTAEPTDSADGKRLRQALAGKIPASIEEMGALFLLDRIGHNRMPGGIESLLHGGTTVLCDRYYYASIAYQGGDDPERRAWISHMNLNCPAIRRPDACLLFDLEPEVAMSRITRRTDTPVEIYETLEQQARIRAQFRAVKSLLDRQDRIFTIHAEKTPDEVAEQVYALWHRLATETP